MTIEMSTKAKRQKLDLSTVKNPKHKSREQLLHQIRNEKWRSKGDTKQSLAEKEKERRKRKTEIESNLQKIISELTLQKYETRIDALEAVLRFLIERCEDESAKFGEAESGEFGEAEHATEYGTESESESIPKQKVQTSDFSQQTIQKPISSKNNFQQTSSFSETQISGILVMNEISGKYSEVHAGTQTEDVSTVSSSAQTLNVNVISTQTQTHKMSLNFRDSMRVVEHRIGLTRFRYNALAEFRNVEI